MDSEHNVGLAYALTNANRFNRIEAQFRRCATLPLDGTDHGRRPEAKHCQGLVARTRTLGFMAAESTLGCRIRPADLPYSYPEASPEA